MSANFRGFNFRGCHLSKKISPQRKFLHLRYKVLPIPTVLSCMQYWVWYREWVGSFKISLYTVHIPRCTRAELLIISASRLPREISTTVLSRRTCLTVFSGSRREDMEENLQEEAEAFVLLFWWQFWWLLSCGYYSSACYLLHINCIQCDHWCQKMIFSYTNIIALCNV